MASLTTLSVEFVSESAGYKNTFGWYNKRTGVGGILFGSIEAEGRNPTVRAGDKVSFTVDSSDVGDIEYFLVPNGGADCDNTSAELRGPIKVIQLANGSWAVASADAQGNVITDARGRPNILSGEGADALFTQTSKNAGAVDYASSAVGSKQTAATLAGDTADGPTGLLAWEDLAATKNRNGTYNKPGDADYNDAVFRISSSRSGNRAPVAVNDTATVLEDGSVLIDVLANDSDPDGNPLTIVAGSLTATNGTAIIENGRIRYTPAANANGPATITYQVSDGTAASNMATVSVTIIPVNDAAVIGAPTVTSVTEDASPPMLTASGNISVLDVDAGEAAFRTTVASAPGNLGTLSLAANGSYTYSVANAAVQFLAAGQSRIERFTVTSIDGTTREIGFTINGVNDVATIAGAATGGAVEDTVTVVSGALSVADIDTGESGFRTLAPSSLVGTYGTFAFDSATGAWSYTLANASPAVQALREGQTAHDTLTVASLDGTASRTIDVAVIGSNDRPIAVLDTKGVVEAGVSPGNTPFAGAPSATGNVLQNDHDIDAGDTLSVQGVAHGSSSGALAGGLGTVVHGTFGSLTLAADGTYAYTLDNERPATNALGQGQSAAEVFSYTVRDAAGTTSTATLTIAVTGTNDAPVLGPLRAGEPVAEGIGNGEFGQYTAARIGVDTYVLTPDRTNLAGAVWGTTDLGQNQTWQTRVYLGDEFGGIRDGADGIAFTLQSQGATAVRTLNDTVPGYHMGANLGVGGVDGQRGLSGAFGVWIDTWANPGAPVEAAGANSISFFQNTAAGFSGLPAGASASPYKFASSLENGQWHDLTVSWDATSQMLSFTFVLQPSGETVTRTQHFDPATLPQGQVYFGFSAGTGNASNLQQVQFLNLGEPTAFTLVESNAALSVSGAIAFTDPDVGDTPEASYDPLNGAAIVDTGIVLSAAQRQAFADAFTVSGSGAWTFNLAAPDYLALEDTVTAIYTIKVTDDFGASVSRDIRITVKGQGSSFVGSVTEDLGVNANGNLVSTGRFDLDDHAFVRVDGQFGNVGSLVVAPDGSYVYTAFNPSSAVQSIGANDVRGDFFYCRRADGTTRTVNFNVNGVNDAPIAQDDSYQVVENQSLLAQDVTFQFGSKPVLTVNDVDADVDLLSVHIVDGPAHGSLELLDALSGRFRYTPDHNFSGADAFTYRLYDGIAYSNMATATISVDRAVFSNADGYAVTEDLPLSVGTSLGVLANDASTHGDPLQASLLVGPQHGLLDLHSDGSFTYVPFANYNGPDSFFYVANDGTEVSPPAEVRLFVAPVNDAPVGVNDIASVDARPTASMSGGLLFNDSDADNDLFDLRVVEIRSGTESPGAPGASVDDLHPNSFTVLNGAYGVLYINGFGMYSYVANSDLIAAATDTFTYTVRDPSGATDRAELIVTVSGDQAPVANDDHGTATRVTGAIGNVRANDSDTDDPLSDLTVVAIRTGGEAETGIDGAVGNLLAGAYGALQLNADGSYSYVADENNPAVSALSGDQTLEDRFTYTIRDPFGAGDVAELVITLQSGSQPPEITGDLWGQVQEDGAVTTGGALMLGGVPGLPTFDVVPGAPTAYGQYSISETGDWTYTLDTASPFVQSLGAFEEIYDSFDVRDSGHFINAAVDITIYGANDAPILAQSPTTFALNGFYDYGGDDHGRFTFADIAFTEIDRTDHVHVVSLQFLGSNYGGQLGSFNASVTEPSLFLGQPGFVQWTYTLLEADYNALLASTSDAAETWRIELDDLHGGTVTRDITIQLVGNAAPSAFDQSLGAAAGRPVDGQMQGFDPENSALTYRIVEGPAHGVVSLDEGSGFFSYTADAGYSGADSLTYAVRDGLADSRIATVAFSVDQPPVVSSYNATIPEDSILSGVLSGFDGEGDPLQFVLHQYPQFGSIALDPSSGTFTYVPNPNYFGFDSFVYSASDGVFSSYNALATIEILPDAGDAPVAPANSILWIEEDTASGLVQFRATDPDGDPLTFSVLSPPDHGTLELVGNSFIYTPDADDFGLYTFTLLISDGMFEVQQTWAVNILGTDDPNSLLANADAYSMDADQVLIASVLANDTNIDRDTIGAFVIDGPAHGVLVFDENGTFNYTPDPAYVGDVTFTYQAFDTSGGSSAAVATIAVASPANFAPTVQAVHIESARGVVTPLVLSGSDYDGTIAYFQLADPASATAFYLDPDLTQAVPPDGRIPALGNSATLNFAPPDGSLGEFGFDFIAIDDAGKPSYVAAHASATVINEAPVAHILHQAVILADAVTDYVPQSVIPIALPSFYPLGGVSHLVVDAAALPGTIYLDEGLTHAMGADGEVAVTGSSTTVYFVPEASGGPAILPFDLIANNGRTLTYAASVGAETGVPLTLIGTDADGSVSEFMLSGFAIPGLSNRVFYFDPELSQPIGAAHIPAQSNMATIFVSTAEYITFSAALRQIGITAPPRYVAIDDNGAASALADINVEIAERSQTADAGGGNDHFVFASPGATATITSFMPGSDTFDISASGFGGNLVAGGAVDVVNTLDPFGEFHLSGDGYFLFAPFDGDVGNLYWDATGGDASDLVTLAIVHGTGALNPNDFHIVT